MAAISEKRLERRLLTPTENKNMIGEVIWCFGQSAAGKKTMIGLLEGDVHLRSLLRIPTPVRIIRESIEWVGSLEMPEKRTGLVRIIEEALRYEKEGAVV